MRAPCVEPTTPKIDCPKSAPALYAALTTRLQIVIFDLFEHGIAERDREVA